MGWAILEQLSRYEIGRGATKESQKSVQEMVEQIPRGLNQLGSKMPIDTTEL